jgi:hypothetical protein
VEGYGNVPLPTPAHPERRSLLLLYGREEVISWTYGTEYVSSSFYPYLDQRESAKREEDTNPYEQVSRGYYT